MWEMPPIRLLSRSFIGETTAHILCAVDPPVKLRARSRIGAGTAGTGTRARAGTGTGAGEGTVPLMIIINS